MQISILRAEQTQLTKSLEKERQKAAENRQEYLALKEEADTHKDRVNQLEEEIRELKRKHKQDLQEALTHRELLQQVSVQLFIQLYFYFSRLLCSIFEKIHLRTTKKSLDQKGKVFFTCDIREDIVTCIFNINPFFI